MSTSLPPESSSSWRSWLGALRPGALGINRRERLRVVLALAAGLAFTALLSRWLGERAAWAGPWLVAPLGASAVLVFGLPASPLAQPWPVVAGNTLSALAGVAVMNLLPWLAPADTAATATAAAWVTPLAAAVAGGLAVGLMMATRSLHPPGGAAAVLAVLAGVTHWEFVLYPVMLNALLLALAGMLINRASGKAYPHGAVKPAAAATASAPPEGAARFTQADIDHVLVHYNQVLDLPRDDLQALLEAAETESHRRRLGEQRCADIMSRALLTVEFGTPLQDAWTLLRQHKVKALPVVDRWRNLVGIVTLADFLRHADLDLHEGFDQRLKQWVRATPGVTSGKPETVGQIMTRKVRVAREERSLAELVPILSDTGHHHIPVVGSDGKLVGILTQTDLVRALVRQTAA